MSQPTYEQVNEIYKAILLGKPIPEGFPETETRLREQIAAMIAAGITPDVQEST